MIHACVGYEVSDIALTKYNDHMPIIPKVYIFKVIIIKSETRTQRPWYEEMKILSYLHINVTKSSSIVFLKDKNV